MSHERLRPTFSFSEERIAQLKAVVPEAFADGKVNWTALREVLSDWLEKTEEGVEHFGLTWPGKRDARRLAALPSPGALLPARGEGVDEEKTRNVFIEGDNLEVLKLLRKSYAGRVKMIYIDPPFNTGHDLIYEDDYAEPIESYLRRTDILDEQGRLLTTNTRADGRFHSRWLSMMYPRLRVAASLLSDEGLLFMSIDDDEAANAKLLLCEIFGEEGFVAQFVWKSRMSEDARAKTGVSTDHEYILCFRRMEDVRLRGAEKDLTKFGNPDNDPRGPWRSADLTGLASKEKRPNLHYDLVDPKGGTRYPPPPKGWRFDKATMSTKIAEGRILFPPEPTGRPRQKLFEREMSSQFKNISTILTSVTTTDGTRELNALLGDNIFDFPKPSELVRIFVEQATGEGDVILDFFSGSGTSGHAVWRQSRLDDRRRSWILVQLPQQVDVGGYVSIADIAKERLRRVIKQLKKEKKPTSNEDLGFRVLKLARSNYRAWNDYHGDDTSEIADLFSKAEETLVQGWTPDGLLAEVMLFEGFPLDSRVEPFLDSKKNSVTKVTSEYCAHKLVVCLDAKVYADTTNALGLGDTDVFVCLDNALTDEAKVRLSDSCILKTI